MRKKVEKLFRLFLTFMAIYLIGNGIIHLLNFRLQSVINVWPQSAVSYAIILNSIYASFVFLAAILLLVVQKDLKKYHTLILASCIWAIFHGLLLIYLSFTQNLINFSQWPSLYVWMPFYNQFLLFEAFLSFVYVALAFSWSKGQK